MCTGVGSREGHVPPFIKITAALLTCSSLPGCDLRSVMRRLSRRQKKGWVDFRATSFSQSQSLNEMLPSFSFSCRVSCASFSSSSWTFPVKINTVGSLSQIRNPHWKQMCGITCKTVTHKRKRYPPLFSPALHYFSFSSWHQPTGARILKSEAKKRGKLRPIRLETVKVSIWYQVLAACRHTLTLSCSQLHAKSLTVSTPTWVKGRLGYPPI